MVRVLGPGNIQISSPSVAGPVRASAAAFGAPQAEALSEAGKAIGRVGQALQRLKDDQQGATDKAFLDLYDLESDLSYGTAAQEEETSAQAGADGLTVRVKERFETDADGIMERVRAKGFTPSSEALQQAESIKLRRQHQYLRRTAVFEHNERVRNFSTQLDASLGSIAQRGVAGGDIETALTRAEQSIEAHKGVLPPAQLDTMRERAAKHFLEQIKANGDPDDLERLIPHLLQGGERQADQASGAAAAAGREAGESGGKPAPSSRNDAVGRAARATGADETMLRIFSRIESGDRPHARTGSYRGRFQLSDGEFRKHGGTGDIFDDDQNSMAAARKLVAEGAAFEQKHGRKPNVLDLYMTHQQGEAGYAAHMAHPGAPAWQNMAGTGEGRRKGAKWAKAAIWGNIPDDMKKRFGGVDDVTSADFVNVWREKVARFGGDAGTMAAPATLRGELAREISTQLPAFQELIDKRREKRELQQRARAIISGDEPVDPNSKDDQKTLDKVVDATDIPARLGEADPRAAGQLTALVKQTGYVPDAAISQLRATSTNGSPEQKVFALETAANLMREKPGALEGSEKSKALRDDAQLYETLTLEAGLGSDVALQRIADLRTPEFAKRKESLKKELAEGGSSSPISQLTPGEIAADYDGLFSSEPELGGSPRQAGVVFDTYRELVKDHYIRTGDIDVAKSMAKKDLKRTYNVTEVTGNRRLIRHPPEAYYPKIEPRAGKAPNLDYFGEQLHATVNNYVRGDVAAENPEARAKALSARGAGAPSPREADEIPLADIFIEPIPQTNADVQAGRFPGYAAVWFEERDGIRVMNTAPGMVFRADVKAARERERVNREQRFRYERDKEIERQERFDSDPFRRAGKAVGDYVRGDPADLRPLAPGMGGAGEDPLGTGPRVIMETE